MPEVFRFSPLLVVAAVAAEVRDAFPTWAQLPTETLPIGRLASLEPHVSILLTGVGIIRAAAAAAYVLGRRRFAALLHIGVGGAYPGAPVQVGDLATAAGECDPQSGIITPAGYQDLGGLGFPLTDAFPNSLMFNSPWADWVAQQVAPAPRLLFATVACCSGTDAAAAAMAARTTAAVENMEGLAVAWTAAQFGVPYAALRAISNFTGDRERQQWNLPAACAALARGLKAILDALPVESDQDCS
ncbi:MAG: futalosine hydrolase [Chloracidobacterium sp.]|nr:futalosine hydrolase [Chloracidobacterium sp.]MDW8216571.1 futalosine hydrolase [Acidobacteriota bacterium]